MTDDKIEQEIQAKGMLMRPIKEHPILFSAPMVRALLDGSKTQTRRVVKWQGPKDYPHNFDLAFVDNPAGVKRLCVPYEHPNDGAPSIDSPAHRHYCPYGDPGDRLWMRETFAGGGGNTIYRADFNEVAQDSMQKMLGFKWKPSIHMPRWASRIDLEITNIRVERLQDISEADALAEGCRPIEGCKWHTFEEADAGVPMHDHKALDAFEALWESINGPGSWDSNPWVWVIEFRRVKAMLGKFVTAKLAGADDCRQGAVISLNPLRIRGESGSEYDCEGTPTAVTNPPETCIGCDLPLGALCKRCEANMEALGKALDAAGLVLTPNV